MNRDINEYINIAKDNNSRKKFAVNAADFVAKYDFDGIDMTWNYIAGE